jgi:hypothetical protein
MRVHDERRDQLDRLRDMFEAAVREHAQLEANPFDADAHHRHIRQLRVLIDGLPRWRADFVGER